MDYDKVWKEMEDAPEVLGVGQIRRRIAPGSTFNLFMGMEKPTNRRLLLFSVSTIEPNVLADYTSTRAVTLLVNYHHKNQTADLFLLLADDEFCQIFTVLVQDLIGVVVGNATERGAINAFLARWQQWQRFLERIGVSGLGREEQIGLYGELWLLKDLLLPTLSNQAVQTWVGPLAAPHDFRLINWAIEVKATAAIAPKAIIVTNEYQLDRQGFDALFLYWIHLDMITGGNATLPSLIDSIRVAFENDKQSKNKFEELLLEVGYLDIHRHLYDSISYIVRDTAFFLVNDNFPRIIPDALPVGVERVQYSVLLQACQKHAVNTDTVISTILDNSHDA